jgi:DNA invertase Pin-like site-specific DNA recombinase
MTNSAALTALDVDLDTTTHDGRMAAQALLSVMSAEHARLSAETKSGLAAARAGRRAAVGDHPELAHRIREMRSNGMTLQAIADALNRDGIPTVRGGSRWRPSSVQSVLGYDRSTAKGP